MTNKGHIKLGDMAREIRSHVCETGLEEGIMHYRTESSRIGDGKDITFTYEFFDKVAEDKVHISRRDDDFQQYLNNLGREGVNLLSYQFGRDFKVTSSIQGETTNISIYGKKIPGYKVNSPRAEESARIELEKIGRILG